MIAPGIVARRPSADGHRRVQDDGIWRHAIEQRREIDKGLEGRARLAPGIRGPVELAGFIIAPTDDGANRPPRRDSHQRPLRGTIALAMFLQCLLHRLLRDFLHAQVDGALHFHRIFAGNTEALHQIHRLAEDKIKEVLRCRIFLSTDDLHLFLQCRQQLAIGDEAGIQHAMQHHFRPPFRGFGPNVRSVFRRRLVKASDNCRFLQRQVAHGFAEIELRRGLYAVIARTQVGTVEIEFQDFVLAQMRLDPQGIESLVNLAPQRTFRREKEVLGKLLGEGGSSLHHALRFGVGDGSAQRTDEVHAEMFVETHVFRRQRGLDDVRRIFGQRDGIVLPHTTPADDLAVFIGDGHGNLAPGVPHVVASGQRRHRIGEDDEREHGAEGGGIVQQIHDKAFEAAHSELLQPCGIGQPRTAHEVHRLERQRANGGIRRPEKIDQVAQTRWFLTLPTHRVSPDSALLFWSRSLYYPAPPDKWLLHAEVPTPGKNAGHSAHRCKGHTNNHCVHRSAAIAGKRNIHSHLLPHLHAIFMHCQNGAAKKCSHRH